MKATDERVTGQQPQRFAFMARLRDDQTAAAEDMAGHTLSVSWLPWPGAGKTVIACTVIARHTTSTLVPVIA